MTMIPCTFGDLGKKARDLLEKNFPLGHIKLEHHAATRHNVDVTIGGVHALDRGRLTGNVESKLRIPNLGATFTEKWSTSNVLTVDASVEDKFVQGLKNGIEVTYEPISGKRAATITNSYKNNYMNLKFDIGLPTSKPILHSSLVLGGYQNKGYLAGLNVSFDTLSNTLSKWQYAVGYDRGDFVLHASVLNHNIFNASLYQRISPCVETALSVTYAHLAHVSNFELAGKYELDGDAWVKAKVDSSSIVTMAYGFGLCKGVKLTLGGQVDGKNLESGNHRVGLALDFES